jgi:hypothetical protein
LKYKQIFLDDVSFEEHLKLQNTEYALYSSVLIVMLDINIDLSHATKSRVLAAAWGRRDYTLSEHLLSLKKLFQLPEIVR